ncbi:MAG: hypothetical protein WB869_12935 [Candidatus Acidiferrales bacterium]
MTTTPTIVPRVSPLASERWIDADPAQFEGNFNRKSFEIRHHLATHPLFQLPKLLELAERTLKNRPKEIYYDAGDVSVEQRWDAIPKKPFSAVEAMQRVETCGAWFIFRSAQNDPEYRVFLDKGLAELKQHMGPGIDSKIMVEDIIIFVTSPKRVTTYHIDRECNFLLQIRGTKSLYVFDREDREVLPEEEMERFWTVDNNAPIYKPHLQQRATTYHLAPGNGVHIPVNCPHWLQNDDNVSVSLSVNFQFKDPLRANVYRANYWLRKFGWKPTPPGKSPILDSFKAQAVKPVLLAQSVYDRLR